jgi:putative transposase
VAGQRLGIKHLDDGTLAPTARYLADTINVGPGQRFDVLWKAQRQTGRRNSAACLPRTSNGALQGRFGDKWHLDECVVAVNGEKQWLWRAVDQDGFVLDVLVQSRRNASAAKRLMRKLLKAQGHAPRVMITDRLRSYGRARQDLMPDVEHRSHKGLNNRAENSRQSIRRRERIMKRFKSARQCQRFVSIYNTIANLFHFPRHTLSSSDHRDLRSAAMHTWREIARVAAA